MSSQKKISLSTVLMAPAQTQPDGTLLVLAESSSTLPQINVCLVGIVANMASRTCSTVTAHWRNLNVTSSNMFWDWRWSDAWKKNVNEIKSIHNSHHGKKYTKYIRSYFANSIAARERGRPSVHKVCTDRAVSQADSHRSIKSTDHRP